MGAVWTAPQHRQLGTGADPVVAHPTPAPVALPGEVGPVTHISAGDSHTLAVTGSGQLYAFGGDDDGEVGIGPLLDGGESNRCPPDAGDASWRNRTGHGDLRRISSRPRADGERPAVCLRQQCVRRARHYRGRHRVAMPTPVTLPGQDGQITQIVAGLDDSRVVTSTGQLYGFGYNINGQLGSNANAGTAHPNPTPAPVRFADGTTIDAVSVGPDALSTLALVWTSPSCPGRCHRHRSGRHTAPRSKQQADRTRPLERATCRPG